MQNETPLSAKRIEEQFSRIVKTYDFLNHLLSFGLDKHWRRHAVQQIRLTPGQRAVALDVCTGTGDMALALELEFGSQLESICALDFAEAMLDQAKAKIKKAGNHDTILPINCDALTMPFVDETFDIVTCAFGIRNLTKLQPGIAEMLRVLKKGGWLVVLEFGRPESALARPFWWLQLNIVIPLIGRLFSLQTAYKYLSSSIQRFPGKEDIMRILTTAQVSKAYLHQFLFGTVNCYVVRR